MEKKLVKLVGKVLEKGLENALGNEAKKTVPGAVNGGNSSSGVGQVLTTEMPEQKLAFLKNLFLLFLKKILLLVILLNIIRIQKKFL